MLRLQRTVPGSLGVGVSLPAQGQPLGQDTVLASGTFLGWLAVLY